jgi:predicted MFS family arabinose efflux permease
MACRPLDADNIDAAAPVPDRYGDRLRPGRKAGMERLDSRIRAFDWRRSWLVLGATTLVVALPAALAFIREGRPADADSSGTVPAASTRDAFRSRALWTLIAVIFGSTLAISGAAVHMVALLRDRGVPAGEGALPLSAMGAASLVGRLTTGWLLDRYACEC